ncbi:MAG: histidine kinase [Saprospiraceae bacterium]|nr:histidine kinase [Saprospiraceae bacterium]
MHTPQQLLTRFAGWGLLLILPIPAWAQLHQNPVIIDEALPSTFVTDIDQDSSGFVWIGTYTGLCRYDGVRVRVLRHDPADTSSLPGSYISDMIYDHQAGLLWVGTDRGLASVDITSLKVIRHAPPEHPELGRRSIGSVTLDRSGNLWLSIAKYGVATRSQQGSWHWSPVPDSLMALDPIRYGGIMDIAESAVSPGTMWVSCGAGIYACRLGEPLHRLHSFAGEDLQNTMYNNQIRTIHPHQDGTLYLGTWSNGLIAYRPDPSIQGARVVPLNGYHKYSSYGVNPPILQHEASALWVPTLRGSCLFDLSHRSFDTCFTVENAVGRSFTFNVELRDMQGRYWASSEYGVYLFDPLNNQFDHYTFDPGDEVYSYVGGLLAEVPGEDLIATTYQQAQGVYLLHRPSRTWTLARPEGAGARTIFRGEELVALPDGRLVVLERQAIYLLDARVGTLERLRTSLDDLNVLWKSMTVDDDGVWWLGTVQSGVIRYDPGSREVRIYRDQFQGDSLPWPVAIDDLYCDGDNNIWVRKAFGYAVIPRSDDQVVNVQEIGGQNIECTPFAEDPYGNVWFAVAGQGLVMTSAETATFRPHRILGSEAGVVNTDIRALAFDRDGLLWMITGSGMQSFDPHTGYSRQFTAADGLVTFDPMFNRNPMVLTHLKPLSTGGMAYAPRGGFSQFDPGAIAINREIPQPYVFSVKSAHGALDVGNAQVTVPQTGLPVTVSLSALGFSQSAQTRFEYSLDTVTQGWQPAPDGNVTFGALQPGTYRLFYRAVNHHGLISPARLFTFRVSVPWWRSLWFYASLVLLAGTGLLGLLSWRRKQRERLTAKENEVQLLLASLESRALRAQMNPHFLFNIFNTIQELILTGDNEMAYEYTSKFSKLLRMILDNASKEEITLEHEVEFLDLYLQLESLRFDDAFSYDIELEAGLEHMHIPVFLMQPLAENAIRHGLLPSKGDKRLEISFVSSDQGLVCRVEDNGVGLSNGTLSRHETDRMHALQLIRHRLLHQPGSSLEIVNLAHDKGVRATIQLPYQ